MGLIIGQSKIQEHQDTLASVVLYSLDPCKRNQLPISSIIQKYSGT